MDVKDLPLPKVVSYLISDILSHSKYYLKYHSQLKKETANNQLFEDRNGINGKSSWKSAIFNSRGIFFI